MFNDSGQRPEMNPYSIASPQDERDLKEKRSFDVRSMPAASLLDLDRRRFEYEYLPAAFAPDVIAANDRSYEQWLAATKMVAAADDPTPTVLGLLVLSAHPRDQLPGAYIQFLRVAGQDLSDPVVDELVLDGPVAEQLRRIDDKLASHNRIAVDITGAECERRSSLYPLPALQQMLRNALMHRSYEATNAPVRVTWFDDRIEISNPGGPYGAVTADNFGEPGVSDYRNPSLAEALRVLGFVQRFGAGISIARRALQDNGSPPPDFEVRPTLIRVTLWPRPSDKPF